MALIQEYNKLFEHTDNIKKIYVNNNIVWPVAQPQPDPKLEPFYVENIENNSRTVQITGGTYAHTTVIEYSRDRTNWSTLGTVSSGVTLSITLNAGDKVYFRSNTNVFDSIGFSNAIKVGGNIMSLLYGSNFTGNETAFPTQDMFTFWAVFRNAGVRYAGDLLLPATTLSQGCYTQMFLGNTSLLTAPALPATTLITQCYSSMFYGCTSLTTAPDLLATTLQDSCYSFMFYGCTNLNSVKCLATTTATDSTTNWLEDVSSTGTFTKSSNATFWTRDANGIPSDWTVIEV